MTATITTFLLFSTITSTTTFLLFLPSPLSPHFYCFTPSPPPPHFYCSHHHHYHHISTVPTITTTTTFLLFPTMTATITTFLLFSTITTTRFLLFPTITTTTTTNTTTFLLHYYHHQHQYICLVLPPSTPISNNKVLLLSQSSHLCLQFSWNSKNEARLSIPFLFLTLHRNIESIFLDILRAVFYYLFQVTVVWEHAFWAFKHGIFLSDRNTGNNSILQFAVLTAIIYFLESQWELSLTPRERVTKS